MPMLLYVPIFKNTHEVSWEHDLNSIWRGVYGSESGALQTVFGQVIFILLMIKIFDKFVSQLNLCKMLILQARNHFSCFFQGGLIIVTKRIT